MQWVNLLLATCAAYLIGSVSFALIVSRSMGLADPRTYGSGNPGATNVLRSGSKWAAALTLLGEPSRSLAFSNTSLDRRLRRGAVELC